MDLFTLAAKIVLDTKEYDKGIDEAEKRGSKFGDSLSKFGNVTKNVAKVATTAVTAASGAIAKITSSSVKAYSQFQQLEGGIDTLFGTAGRTLQEYQKSLGITEKSTQKAVNESVKNYQKQQKAYDNVMAKAKTAYVRAGVSMNTYMETVTSFSASLIQSLQGDTEAAAEVADRAIVDMSDNANKMGTALESIQNAYQGFAKQNYTMLDNLKLGYGGTKTEMQRLIKDAAAMTDIQERLNVTVDQGSMSFSNIVNAISVMQEHLNIAGTTSKEAATTIEGSLKMVKASWEDLKVSLVDPNGDINGAIDNLVSSVGIAAENLVPAISRALKGTGKLIKEIAPVLSEELPGIIEEVLPDLISGGVTLVSALAKALVENIPVLLEAAGQVLDAVIQEFGKSDSPILQGVANGLTLVKNALEWIKDHQQETVDAIGLIAGALAGLKIADTVIKGLELLQGFKGLGSGGTGSAGSGGTGNWLTKGLGSLVKIAPWLAGGAVLIDTSNHGRMEEYDENGNFITYNPDNFEMPMNWNPTWKTPTGKKSGSEVSEETLNLPREEEYTKELQETGAYKKDRSGQHSFWNTVENRNTNKTKSTYEELLDPNSDASQLLNSGAEEYFNPTEKPKPAKTPAKNGMKQVREYQELQELLDPNSTTSKKLKELTEKGIEVPVKPKEIEKFVEEVEKGAQEKPPQIELKPKENAAQELSDGVGTVDVKTKSVWSTLFQSAQDFFNNNELITKFKGKWSELIEKGKEALSNNPFGLKTVADWIEFFRNGQEQANRTELSVPTDLEPDPNEAEELAAEVGTVTTKAEVEAEAGANSKLSRQIGTVHVPVSFVGGAGGGGGGGGGSRNNMTGGYIAFHAKGDWDIPFDNYPALLHRNEMVLTASQARRYREGEDGGGGFSLAALGQVVAQAVREGMRGVSVNSYLDGRNLTDEIMRIAGSDQAALRYV